MHVCLLNTSELNILSLLELGRLTQQIDGTGDNPRIYSKMMTSLIFLGFSLILCFHLVIMNIHIRGFSYQTIGLKCYVYA